MAFLGYSVCDKCKSHSYINELKEIKIWYHPDDGAVAQVTCECGEKIEGNLPDDHLQNFMRRGVKVKGFNDRFTPLTEAMIDEWEIDKELQKVS